MTFASHLADVNAMLAKLRGTATSPIHLLAELRTAGIEMTRDGDNLRVRGKITDEQRQQIKTHKTGLLALLGSDQSVAEHNDFDFWDPEEAENTVVILKCRLRGLEYPESEAARAEYAKAMNAIDSSYVERNLKKFKGAVDALIAFLDTQPKHLGNTTYYDKPPGPLVAAWVRTSFSKKRWLRIMGDVPKGQEEVLIEYVNDYMKASGLSQCETKILDEGIDPNEKKQR